MKVVGAEELNRVLTYPALIEALARGLPCRRHGAAAPPPSDRAARRGSDGAVDAGLDRRRRLVPRLQDRHGVSRQRQAAAPIDLRQLHADVGRDRRAARRDGRHHAHRLAHGLRLRARRLVSGARGCGAPGDDRRGRARAAPRARACERAADQARHVVEPHAQARRADRVRSFGRRARGRGQRRSRGCGARGRHRLLRDALGDADRARQVAEEGRACRSGRRLHAEDARGRRRRDPEDRASMSTRAPARSRKAATSCSR